MMHQTESHNTWHLSAVHYPPSSPCLRFFDGLRSSSSSITISVVDRLRLWLSVASGVVCSSEVLLDCWGNMCALSGCLAQLRRYWSISNFNAISGNISSSFIGKPVNGSVPCAIMCRVTARLLVSPLGVLQRTGHTHMLIDRQTFLKL